MITFFLVRSDQRGISLQRVSTLLFFTDCFNGRDSISFRHAHNPCHPQFQKDWEQFK